MTWIALALILGLATTGCGGDPSPPFADGANELSAGAEELVELALREGRADLELTATATPIADGAADVMLEFALLDRVSLSDPTVTFDLPAGQRAGPTRGVRTS